MTTNRYSILDDLLLTAVHGGQASRELLQGLDAEQSSPVPCVEAADPNPERRDNGCMTYRGKS